MRCEDLGPEKVRLQRQRAQLRKQRSSGFLKLDKAQFCALFREQSFAQGDELGGRAGRSDEINRCGQEEYSSDRRGPSWL